MTSSLPFAEHREDRSEELGLLQNERIEQKDNLLHTMQLANHHVKLCDAGQVIYDMIVEHTEEVTLQPKPVSLNTIIAPSAPVNLSIEQAREMHPSVSKPVTKQKPRPARIPAPSGATQGGLSGVDGLAGLDEFTGLGGADGPPTIPGLKELAPIVVAKDPIAVAAVAAAKKTLKRKKSFSFGKGFKSSNKILQKPKASVPVVAKRALMKPKKLGAASSGKKKVWGFGKK